MLKITILLSGYASKYPFIYLVPTSVRLARYHRTISTGKGGKLASVVAKPPVERKKKEYSSSRLELIHVIEYFDRVYSKFL